MKEERPDDALELLSSLEASFPNQYEVIAGIGLAAYFKDDYSSAVAYLARAKEIRPPDVTVLNALGESHQNLGQIDDAREAFERSIALDPDQPAVHERLASLTRR